MGKQFILDCLGKRAELLGKLIVKEDRPGHAVSITLNTYVIKCIMAQIADSNRVGKARIVEGAVRP